MRRHRLSDYFPASSHQHIVKPGSGFGSHPDLRHNGGAPLPEMPTKWRSILSLELQGNTKTEIAQLMGMSVGGVSHITTDERYIHYRDEYLAQIDGEFFAMKPLAFDALRAGLKSQDENVALRASEQWFRGASFGGFAKEPATPNTATAEDIAKRLLEVHAENVQINIGARGDD